MDSLTRRYITAKNFFSGRFSKTKEKNLSDSGQASTEYAGILFVIVAIIAAVVAGGLSDIGDILVKKMKEAVEKIG
ncbi:MAG: hypothetical protein ACRCTR_07325 [Actinomycetota bacterium]